MNTDDSLADPNDQIRRYDAAVPDDAPSGGDPAIIDAVDRHIAETLGPVESVFHELVSPYVHVDVHHVLPSTERPFHVLVTTGMSEMPMTTPEGAEEFRYAELLMCLPAEWPISDEGFRDERHYWPVRWLRQLARFPHEYGTWLSMGHSVPNGDPPEPFAVDTKLSGMLLIPPVSLPEEAWKVALPDGRSVHLWSLLALYPEEMVLKLQRGADALLELLEKNGVDDVLDKDRPNVAARRRWWSR